MFAQHDRQNIAASAGGYAPRRMPSWRGHPAPGEASEPGRALRLSISAATRSALRSRGRPGLMAANGSGLPPPKLLTHVTAEDRLSGSATVPGTALGLQEEEGLPILDGVRILDEYLLDAPRNLRFDFVH